MKLHSPYHAPMLIAGSSAGPDTAGGDTGRDPSDQHPAATDPAAAPAPKLPPGLVERFRALVEEVTDELMQGRTFDRASCRADAITLLMATSEQMEEPREDGESPLRYLLMEEQRKAAALLAHPGSMPLGFVKV